MCIRDRCSSGIGATGTAQRFGLVSPTPHILRRHRGNRNGQKKRPWEGPSLGNDGPLDSRKGPIQRNRSAKSVGGGQPSRCTYQICLQVHNGKGIQSTQHDSAQRSTSLCSTGHGCTTVSTPVDEFACLDNLLDAISDSVSLFLPYLWGYQLRDFPL